MHSRLRQGWETYDYSRPELVIVGIVQIVGERIYADVFLGCGEEIGYRGMVAEGLRVCFECLRALRKNPSLVLQDKRDAWDIHRGVATTYTRRAATASAEALCCQYLHRLPCPCSNQ